MKLAAGLVAVLLLIVQLVSGFSPRVSSTRGYLLYGAKLEALQEGKPLDEKCAVRLVVRGSSVSSALFRSSLKKEMTFFRGLSGVFNHPFRGDNDLVEVVSEGKTVQLVRFNEWIKTLTVPTSERKPNFQGPSILVEVIEAAWKPFTGTLKGFSSADEPPELESVKKESDKKQLEAKNMAGTDESV